MSAVKLFDYPDTSWVAPARDFLNAQFPENEFKEHAVKAAVSVINMQKVNHDAVHQRVCMMGVLGILDDVLRHLHHNPFWMRVSSEIGARLANGLSRSQEAAQQAKGGYKMKQDMSDAAFIEGQMAWLDAIVFIYETLEPEGDRAAFRTSLRKLLYNL